MVGGDACGDRGEERECVYCEREQQPAQKRKTNEAEDDADDDHGGGLRGIDLTDTPSTTSTAQSRNSKSVSRLESGSVFLFERRGWIAVEQRRGQKLRRFTDQRPIS